MNSFTLFQKVSLFGIFLFAFSLPISFVPAEFGMGVAVLGWLLEGIVRKNWQVRWHPFFLPLITYIGWNTMSAAASPRPLHSLWAVADNEWSVCIMLLMYWVIRDKEILVKVTYAFLITSTVNMTYALWQTFAGVELYRSLELHKAAGWWYRAVGFQGFYLTFAAFAMAAFFLSINLLLNVKGKIRTWLGFLAFASFLSVVGTLARSIWLAFVVAIPVFGFLKGKRTGYLVTGLFAGTVFLSLVFLPPLRTRALSIFEPEKNETRLNLWKTTMNMARDFPVMGVGEDNFDFYFERYRVEGYYDTTTHPHNDYLNVLVSSGIVGLVSFLALWVLAIREGYRAASHGSDPLVRSLAMGGMLSILGFLVGSLFQNYYGTFANCLEWWFVTGLIFTSGKFTQGDPSLANSPSTVS